MRSSRNSSSNPKHARTQQRSGTSKVQGRRLTRSRHLHDRQIDDRCYTAQMKTQVINHYVLSGQMVHAAHASAAHWGEDRHLAGAAAVRRQSTQTHARQVRCQECSPRRVVAAVCHRLRSCMFGVWTYHVGETSCQGNILSGKRPVTNWSAVFLTDLRYSGRPPVCCRIFALYQIADLSPAI